MILTCDSVEPASGEVNALFRVERTLLSAAFDFAFDLDRVGTLGMK